MEITFNTKFLYKLRPERMVLIAILMLLVMLILAPIQINNTLDFSSVVYIVSSLLAFLLGTKMIRTRAKRQQLTIQVNIPKLTKIYNLTFWLGFIGVVFRYYDLFFFRGLSLASTTLENMEMATEESGNIFSIVASLLIFNVYIPLTIDLVCDKLNTRKRKILTLLVFFSLMINALLSGSRFAIITPLVYWFILLLYAGKIKIRWSVKNVAIGLFILLGVGYLIGALFIRRLNEQDVTAVMAVSSVTGGYSDKVPATASFQRLLSESEDEWYYVYLFTYSNITQYGTHAIFEFPVVKKFIDQKNDHYYGTATFSVITKFILKIFNSPYNILEQIYKHNARPGIWSTFFFLWYLDFGWMGIVFMFIFGYFAKKVWANVYYLHNILYLPLLCFLSIVLLLILQLNYIAGSGTYALFSFVTLPLIFKSPICGVVIHNK